MRIAKSGTELDLARILKQSKVFQCRIQLFPAQLAQEASGVVSNIFNKSVKSRAVPFGWTTTNELLSYFKEWEKMDPGICGPVSLIQ